MNIFFQYFDKLLNPVIVILLIVFAYRANTDPRTKGALVNTLEFPIQLLEAVFTLLMMFGLLVLFAIIFNHSAGTL